MKNQEQRNPTEFNYGYPMMCPKDCGKLFGDLTLEEMRSLSSDLTKEESECPHSKYFYIEPIKVSKEQQTVLDGSPMDSSKGFMPHEYGSYMNNTGHCEVENGYCILPNGVAFASVLIEQQGLTDEMIDLYNKEFAPKDNLFYKIWYPGCHILHYADGALENFGWGRINLKFDSRLDITDLGIDIDKVRQRDPKCIHIGGNACTAYAVEGVKTGEPEKLMLVFYHRKTSEGREVRIRLWYGVSIEDGKYVFTIPDGGVPVDVARSLMSHLMHEYSNDVRLIKHFWEDKQQKKI